MAGTAGRVAVVDASGTVVDLLGYGGSVVAEGSAAPSPSNTTSVTRTNTCVDTDDNAADFSTASPSPQNGTTPHEDCVAPPPVAQPTIAEIQGRSHLSPLAGKPVANVPGVVTVLGPQGFWMQSEAPDDDPGTSEGVYVFTRSAPTVAIGDRVTVNGTVSEFRPGGASGNDNTTTTEIVSPVVTTRAGARRCRRRSSSGWTGSPRSRTSRRATRSTSSTTGRPTARRPTRSTSTSRWRACGSVCATRRWWARPPRSARSPSCPAAGDGDPQRHGGVVYGGYDQPNTARVQLDDALLPAGSMPAADVGDSIPGETVGVVDYSFSNYKLELTTAPVLRPGGLKREVTARQGRGELAMATFNVENLAPGNPQTKFDRLAGQVVTNLRARTSWRWRRSRTTTAPPTTAPSTPDQTVARLTAAIRRPADRRTRRAG